MCADVSEYGRALQLSIKTYLEYYWNSKARYAVISLAPAFSALAGLVDPGHSDALYALTVLSVGLSAVYVFYTGRPFGVEVSLTPTHLVDGTREPDVPSKNRDIVLLQEEENKIHGEVELSRLTRSFELEFAASSGINVELEATPRNEHEYLPKQNILECDSVSEFSFPLKIGIYPARGVNEVGRYHTLKVYDNRSGRILRQFDAINVRH